MPKEFDASLNSLIDDHLEDWGRWLSRRVGCPAGPIQALDTDLSATLQADRLFRINSSPPAIIHLELESSGRSNIAHELLRYNMAAWGTLEQPVHSVVLLLRPKANALDLTGQLNLIYHNDSPYLTFHYTVIRLWEESYEALLNAGPGLIPLALLTNQAAANVTAAFEQFTNCLLTLKLPEKVRDDVLGTTFVLSGLRYNRDELLTLFRRLSMTLKESTTYQWIWEQGEEKGLRQGKLEGLQQGKLEELRQVLLRLGSKRFGSAPAEFADAINNEERIERLEELADRLLDATDWATLFAHP